MKATEKKVELIGRMVFIGLLELERNVTDLANQDGYRILQEAHEWILELEEELSNEN